MEVHSTKFRIYFHGCTSCGLQIYLFKHRAQLLVTSIQLGNVVTCISKLTWYNSCSLYYALALTQNYIFVLVITKHMSIIMFSYMGITS